MKKSLEEMENTRLNKCYLVIYALKNIVNVRHNNIINEKSMYSFIAINARGQRKYLGSFIEKENEGRFWLDVFETFKNKGLEDVFFFVSDNNSPMNKCMKIAYPLTNFIDILLDINDKFYKYFPDKYSTKIGSEIKQLVVQESINKYQYLFTIFKDKYANNLVITTLINKYLNGVDFYYQYDLNIRSVLFNDYLLKEFKKNISKINKQLGYITCSNDIMYLVLEQLNTIENHTSYNKKQWLAIMNSFYLIFKDRMEELL